jgi:hypothetical protein
MKKLILIVTIVLFHFSSFASWRNAMIRVKHERGRAISVTIDGRKYDRIGRTITIGDLPPGNHQIKIFKYNSNGYGYSQGVPIYQGTVRMKPGRIYYATVANNVLDVEENCCLDDMGKWNHNNNWADEENEMGYRDERDANESNWNNNHQWDNDRRDNYNDNAWENFNGQMSEGRFNQLIDQIRKASFENSKVSVAKQALKNNRISCRQLLSIINEFSFETTKLQFAKDTYPKVGDKQNYFILNDAFTFQSSKDELTEFLDRSR